MPRKYQKRCHDPLYLEEVERARSMSPEEKLLAGQQMFMAAREVTLAGIRQQFPEASQVEAEEIFRQRLARQRRATKTRTRLPDLPMENT